MEARRIGFILFANDLWNHAETRTKLIDLLSLSELTEAPVPERGMTKVTGVSPHFEEWDLSNGECPQYDGLFSRDGDQVKLVSVRKMSHLAGSRRGSFIIDQKYWMDAEIQNKITALLSLTEAETHVKHLLVTGVSPIFEEWTPKTPNEQPPLYDLIIGTDGNLHVIPHTGEQHAPAQAPNQG